MEHTNLCSFWKGKKLFLFKNIYFIAFKVFSTNQILLYYTTIINQGAKEFMVPYFLFSKLFKVKYDKPCKI